MRDCPSNITTKRSKDFEFRQLEEMEKGFFWLAKSEEMKKDLLQLRKRKPAFEQSSSDLPGSWKELQ